MSASLATWGSAFQPPHIMAQRTHQDMPLMAATAGQAVWLKLATAAPANTLHHTHTKQGFQLVCCTAAHMLCSTKPPCCTPNAAATTLMAQCTNKHTVYCSATHHRKHNRMRCMQPLLQLAGCHAHTHPYLI
jgi:hypothetical protein